MIGLCSKTYIVSKDNDDYKFSCKGISKRFVENPLNIYKQVLETGNSASGTNKGFRVKDHGIFTYTQQRCGFTYFYCKRKVMDDGIHTVPLYMTLCPVPKDGVSCSAGEKESASSKRDESEATVHVDMEVGWGSESESDEEVSDSELIEMLANVSKIRLPTFKTLT